MTSSAVVSPPLAPERTDHLCWVYDDPAAFRDRAIAFLTAGIAAGQRVEYIGPDDLDELHHHLAAMEGLDDLLADGRITVRSLADMYGVDHVVEPHAPVAAYTAATQRALADGYTGLCVVAEATALVRTPAQREAFTRYEHLVDRYMAANPFSAMCAYNVRELGTQTAAELACLHPHASSASTPFQWSAAQTADMRLAGELDAVAHPLFDTALTRTMPFLVHDDVVVDATGVEFIDHRALLILEDHAAKTEARVELLTAAPMVHRLGRLLGLRAVQVVWAG